MSQNVTLVWPKSVSVELSGTELNKSSATRTLSLTDLGSEIDQYETLHNGKIKTFWDGRGVQNDVGDAGVPGDAGPRRVRRHPPALGRPRRPLQCLPPGRHPRKTSAEKPRYGSHEGQCSFCFLHTRMLTHRGGRARNSDEICLFTLDSTPEIYIPSNSQETGLQTYSHIFSWEVKMVAILMDLNWKWSSENIRPL